MKKAAAILAILLAGASGAAGVSSVEYQKAAEAAASKWLPLVDAGKYGPSWDESAALFRKSLTRAQWESAVSQARAPLGKLVQRELQSASYTTSLPNVPPGDYVILVYASDFENRKGATETVVPMKDPDGVWRVSGYFIR